MQVIATTDRAAVGCLITDEKHVDVDPREVEKQRRSSTAEALKAILV